ncbi:MAG TPA: hypothetical protein VFI72_01020, partial [Candidatus Angelobacter sp.]|nr:hypothetical protein [Candidatus Angelobacter sp.]
GQFPKTRSRSVPVLPFQQNAGRPGRIIHGKNHDRAGMLDDIAAHANAIRLGHFLRHYTEHTSLEGGFRR